MLFKKLRTGRHKPKVMEEKVEKIPELLTDDELDDEEIEKLEEQRRNGDKEKSVKSGKDGDDEDDEDGDYYTLPPSRSEMLEDWTEWRKTVNELMSDVIAKKSPTLSLETEREILTSSNNSKTPDFFNGSMSIHGQRVKDQYGCVAINEDDDTESKVEKKIMEGNFYLFGIPRLSVRRCSEGKIDVGRLSTYHRQPSNESETIAQRRKSVQILLPEKSDLQNTDDLEEIEDRPFQGLAKARRHSLSASRRNSTASALSFSRSSSNNSTASGF